MGTEDKIRIGLFATLQFNSTYIVNKHGAAYKLSINPPTTKIM